MSPKIKIPLFLAALALLWWGAVNLAFERGLRTGMNQELPTFHEQRLQMHAFHLELLAKERLDVIAQMSTSSTLLMLIQINERDLGNPKKSDLAGPIIRSAGEIEAIDARRLGAMDFDLGWRESLRRELAQLRKESNS